MSDLLEKGTVGGFLHIPFTLPRTPVITLDLLFEPTYDSGGLPKLNTLHTHLIWRVVLFNTIKTYI